MTKMAAWGMMPAKKVIGGRTYEYYETYTTKFDAKQVARKLRASQSHVVRAQVVVQQVGGYKRYHVYARPTRLR